MIESKKNIKWIDYINCFAFYNQIVLEHCGLNKKTAIDVMRDQSYDPFLVYKREKVYDELLAKLEEAQKRSQLPDPQPLAPMYAV